MSSHFLFLSRCPTMLCPTKDGILLLLTHCHHCTLHVSRHHLHPQSPLSRLLHYRDNSRFSTYLFPRVRHLSHDPSPYSYMFSCLRLSHCSSFLDFCKSNRSFSSLSLPRNSSFFDLSLFLGTPLLSPTYVSEWFRSKYQYYRLLTSVESTVCYLVVTVVVLSCDILIFLLRHLLINNYTSLRLTI